MSLATRLTALVQAIGADIKALNTKVNVATKPMDTWHLVGAAGEPAFVAPWTNFGSGEQVAAFRKDLSGHVTLRGAVKSGALTAVMFTLPVGYRPPAALRFAVEANSAYGQVTVFPNGEVKQYVGSNVLVDLASIEFDTDSVTELSVLVVGAAQAAVPMDTWHTVGAAGEPAFTGTWVNFDPPGATARLARFTKDPLGRVHLTGFLKSGANGTGAFTLPVGYRPARLSVIHNPGAVGGSAQIEINSAGVVAITNLGTATTAAFVSLDGVYFDTESVTQMPTGPQGPKGDPGGVDVLTTLDWNTALVPGFYRSTNVFTQHTNNGPGDTLNPPQQAGITSAHASGALVQRVWDLDFQVSYTRFRDITGTWSAWVPDLVKPKLFTDAVVGGADPKDGEERYFQNAAMKVLGILWKFRYDASSASAYKWVFAGGSEWIDEVLTEESTGSNAYTNMATVGPRVDLPLPGDYVIGHGAGLMGNTNGIGVMMAYSTNVAANNADNADRIYLETQVAGQRNLNASRRRLKTGLAAAPVIAKYAVTSNTGYFVNRWLSVIPKRVSM